uniref:Uncharacterized protein n=1 Tax=Oryza meridionalis TaxID=40149 RepID=A0A0E0C788_9ORYZ
MVAGAAGWGGRGHSCANFTLEMLCNTSNGVTSPVTTTFFFSKSTSNHDQPCTRGNRTCTQREHVKKAKASVLSPGADAATPALKHFAPPDEQARSSDTRSTQACKFRVQDTRSCDQRRVI